MDAQSDFKSKALATFSVFARNETVLGLPFKVVVLGAGTTLSVMFLLYWFAGFAYGVVFFYGMYQIHQKDPKALEIWVIALRRSFTNKSSRWSAGKCKSTRLVILKAGN